MKSTKILACLSAAAIISMSAIPAVCSAADYSAGQSERTVKAKSVTVDFVILGYKEKNGELTITGCYDYSPIFSCNGGYIAVCVFNGEIQIPSHIDSKAVIGIKSLSGCEKISKAIIPETVTDISKTAFSGCTLKTETTDKEYKLITMYY